MVVGGERRGCMTRKRKRYVKKRDNKRKQSPTQIMVTVGSVGWVRLCVRGRGGVHRVNTVVENLPRGGGHSSD